jgi:hypothetical protein
MVIMKKIKTDDLVEKKVFLLTRIKDGFSVIVTRVSNITNHSKPTDKEIESIKPVMGKNLDMKIGEKLTVFYEGYKV